MFSKNSDIELARNLAQKKVDRCCRLREVCRIEWRMDLGRRIIRCLVAQLGSNFPSGNTLLPEPSGHGVPERVRLDIALERSRDSRRGPAAFHAVDGRAIVYD